MPRNHKRRLSTIAVLIAIVTVAITTMSQTSATVTDASAKFDEFRDSRAKPRNYITQLIFEMENSLVQLKATDLTISKLEEMAVFIYESMSISTRNYHSVQHVFDIIGHDVRLENNPIAIIAACFHDCIYYHLDGGLTPRMAALLKGSFEITDPDIEQYDDSDYINAQTIYKFFATDKGKGIDMHLQMVETIFGYTVGQNIRILGDGLNEFLSAVVAVRMLKDHLPMEILAQIACCIEATIPFLQADQATEKTHMARLHDNMKKVKQVYNLELSDEDLVTSVQRACLLSNSDVGNFGTTDRLWFLDNAWSLLTEQNESLRNQYVYSVDHFLVALHKMYKFYKFVLQPAVVFHEFQGVPAASEMENLMQECRNNLAFGMTYVGAKYVAMSLVSALAVLTGGDAPISLFTGDLRMTERQSSQVMTCPPSPLNSRASDVFQNKTCNNSQHPPDECLKSCTHYVYEILAEGRRSESSFDTKRSPWAALLCGYLGDEGLNRILKEHTLYPMTAERAWIVLRALPLEPVNTIVQSISKQAPSRADRISEIISQL
jgi:hypothetical protein